MTTKQIIHKISGGIILTAVIVSLLIGIYSCFVVNPIVTAICLFAAVVFAVFIFTDDDADGGY